MWGNQHILHWKQKRQGMLLVVSSHSIPLISFLLQNRPHFFICPLKAGVPKISEILYQIFKEGVTNKGKSKIRVILLEDKVSLASEAFAWSTSSHLLCETGENIAKIWRAADSCVIKTEGLNLSGMPFYGSMSLGSCSDLDKRKIMLQVSLYLDFYVTASYILKKKPSHPKIIKETSRFKSIGLSVESIYLPSVYPFVPPLNYWDMCPLDGSKMHPNQTPRPLVCFQNNWESYGQTYWNFNGKCVLWLATND